MDYTTLGLEDLLKGYQNRIQQLEIEHFSNSVYAEEAQFVGATEQANQFKENNESIESRITLWQNKKNEILEKIKETEDGDNAI